MYQKVDGPIDVYNKIDNKIDMNNFIGSYYHKCTLWYRMDNMLGTKVKDWSFSRNEGSISGATWTVGGKFNHCLYFTLNDEVTATDSISLSPTKELTLECWLKTTTQMTSVGAIGKANVGANDWDYMLYLR